MLSRSIENVNKGFLHELFKERYKGTFTAPSFSRVLSKERIAHLPHRSRLLDELPHTSGERIETVIHAAFEIENHGLIAKIGRHGIL